MEDAEFLALLQMLKVVQQRKKHSGDILKSRLKKKKKKGVDVATVRLNLVPNLCKFSASMFRASKKTYRANQRGVEELLLELTTSEGIHTHESWEVPESVIIAICNSWTSLYSSQHSTKVTLLTILGVLISKLGTVKYQGKVVTYATIGALFKAHHSTVSMSAHVANVVQASRHDLSKEKNDNVRSHIIRCLSSIISSVNEEVMKKNFSHVRGLLMSLSKEKAIFVIEAVADLLNACSLHPSFVASFVDLTVPFTVLLYENAKLLSPRLARTIGRVICRCSATLSEFGMEESDVGGEDKVLEQGKKQKQRMGRIGSKDRARRFSAEFIFNFMDNHCRDSEYSPRVSSEQISRFRWLVHECKLEYYAERRRLEPSIHIASELNAILTPVMVSHYKDGKVDSSYKHVTPLVEDILCRYCAEQSAVGRNSTFDALCEFLVHTTKKRVKCTVLSAIASVLGRMGSSAVPALQGKPKFEKFILSAIVRSNSNDIFTPCIKVLQSASLTSFVCCARYLSIFAEALMNSQLKEDDFGDTSWIGTTKSKGLPISVVLRCCKAAAGLLSCVKGYSDENSEGQSSLLSPPLEIPESVITSFLIFGVDLVYRQTEYPKEKLTEIGCLLITSVIHVGRSFNDKKSHSLLLSLWKDRLLERKDFTNGRTVAILSTVLTYLQSAASNQRRLQKKMKSTLFSIFKCALEELVDNLHGQKEGIENGSGTQYLASILFACLVNVDAEFTKQLVSSSELGGELIKMLIHLPVSVRLEAEDSVEGHSDATVSVSTLLVLPSIAFIPSNLSGRYDTDGMLSEQFEPKEREERNFFLEYDLEEKEYDMYKLLFPSLGVEVDGEQTSAYIVSMNSGGGDSSEEVSSFSIPKEGGQDEISKTLRAFRNVEISTHMNFHMAQTLLGARILGILISTGNVRSKSTIYKKITKIITSGRKAVQGGVAMENYAKKDKKKEWIRQLFVCIALLQAIVTDSIRSRSKQALEEKEKEQMSILIVELIKEIPTLSDRTLALWMSNTLSSMIPMANPTLVSDIFSASEKSISASMSLDPYSPTPVPLFCYLDLLVRLFDLNNTLRTPSFLSSLSSLYIRGACDLPSLECKKDCLACIRATVDTAGPLFVASSFQSMISLRSIQYSSPSPVHAILIGVNPQRHITQVHSTIILPALGKVIASIVSALGPELRNKANLPIYYFCSEFASPFMFREWRFVDPFVALDLFAVGSSIERSLLVMNPYANTQWSRTIDSLIQLLRDEEDLNIVSTPVVRELSETMRQFLSSSSAVADGGWFLQSRIADLSSFLFHLIDVSNDRTCEMHVLYSLRNLLSFTLSVSHLKNKADLGNQDVSISSEDYSIDIWIRNLVEVVEGGLNRLNTGNKEDLKPNTPPTTGEGDAEEEWDKKTLQQGVTGGGNKVLWRRSKTKAIAFLLLRSTIKTYAERLKEESVPLVCSTRSGDGFLQKDVVRLINVVSKACSDAIEGFQLLHEMVSIFGDARDVSSSEGVEEQFILLQHVAELSMAVRSPLTTIHPTAKANSIAIAASLVCKFHNDKYCSVPLIESFVNLCNCQEIHKDIYFTFSWFSKATSSAIKILTLTSVAEAWISASSSRPLLQDHKDNLFTGWIDIIKDICVLILQSKYKKQIFSMATLLPEKPTFSLHLLSRIHFVLIAAIDHYGLLRGTKLHSDHTDLLGFVLHLLLRGFIEYPIFEQRRQKIWDHRLDISLHERQLLQTVLALVRYLRYKYPNGSLGESLKEKNAYIQESLSVVRDVISCARSQREDPSNIHFFSEFVRELVQIVEECGYVDGNGVLFELCGILLGICWSDLENTKEFAYSVFSLLIQSSVKKSCPGYPIDALLLFVTGYLRKLYKEASIVEEDTKFLVSNILGSVLIAFAKDLSAIRFFCRFVFSECKTYVDSGLFPIIQPSLHLASSAIDALNGEVPVQISDLFESICTHGGAKYLPVVYSYLIEDLKDHCRLSFSGGSRIIVDAALHSFFMLKCPPISLLKLQLELLCQLLSEDGFQAQIFPPFLITIHWILKSDSPTEDTTKALAVQKLILITNKYTQEVKDHMQDAPPNLKDELQTLSREVLMGGRT